jgi:hypothetical protein
MMERRIWCSICIEYTTRSKPTDEFISLLILIWIGDVVYCSLSAEALRCNLNETILALSLYTLSSLYYYNLRIVSDVHWGIPAHNKRPNSSTSEIRKILKTLSRNMLRRTRKQIILGIISASIPSSETQNCNAISKVKSIHQRLHVSNLPKTMLSAV